MINTKTELLQSTASAAVVSADLIREITLETKLPALLAIDTTDKASIVINRGLIDSIKNKLNPTDRMAPVRAARKSNGGRKRLPEPTPEEIANMQPAERLKYNNRIWQRNSRKARGIGKPNGY